MSACMCGADDCPRCFPSNFRHGFYIGDMDDQEMQDFEDAYDEQMCHEADVARENERCGI
jgi:hypothetical protein